MRSVARLRTAKCIGRRTPPAAESAQADFVSSLRRIHSLCPPAARCWTAAGKVFHLGMLMYGKEPTWAEVRRWMRETLIPDTVSRFGT